MSGFYAQWLNERFPAWFARGYFFSSRLWRTRVIGLENLIRHPVIVLALWHHDELATLPFMVHQDYTVLISQSRDGDLMSRGATTLGYRAVRGSSTRGAVGGLVALMKAAREGYSTIFTVDGPRGPARVAKPGVIRVAQKTGRPIVPYGVVADRKFIFQKAWNKVYVPYPGSRVVYALGEPLLVAPGDDQEAACARLGAAIDDCRARARAALSDWDHVPRVTLGVLRLAVKRSD
jgi:lysophospholipid acyltransferase (LPLAT)-like uncharacterized protein